MGRRKRQEDDGFLADVLTLAWEFPVAGLVLSAVLLGVGLWLRLVPFDPLKAWYNIAPILGIALSLVGAAGVLVGLAGLVRKFIRSRSTL